MENMRNTVEISMAEYKYLLALQERVCVLEREMKARVREKRDWMGLDDLKTIFDLWEDVPEIVRKTDPPCDTELSDDSSAHPIPWTGVISSSTM